MCSDLISLFNVYSKARDCANEERIPAIFSQGKSKRLEFSNISLCLYGGHKSLINDIFLNTSIK